MTKSIGIRREDKNQWERRVPLDPGQVRKLVSKGFDIYIQPSEIRIFLDQEYAEVGATVQEDLSGCDFVVGVKEFPKTFFREGKAYMFFSHVIKGQEYNMAMLQSLLDLGCTLFDYEKIINELNMRHVYFGNYAGLAGVLESLYTLGKRLEWEGVDTPFSALKRPLDYSSLGEAKAALEVVGKWISKEGLPDSLSPMVVGFSGYGNVSKGAQEIIDILPIQELAPSELASFMSKGEFDRFKVYKVVFYEKDMVVPVDPNVEFQLQEYFDRPVGFRGVFEQYLPNLTMLINCIYWAPQYPMLVTKQWLKENWTRGSRLKVLGDITCDIEGSIECTLEATEPGNPCYVYDIQNDAKIYGWEGMGPVVMSVDTLPSELPRESSSFFGNQLLPFIEGLKEKDLDLALNELAIQDELMRALIVHKGKLTPDFEYLQEHL